MPMEVFIEPLDEDLKCIKLTNKGSETLSLGGHKLSCTSEGDSSESTTNAFFLSMIFSQVWRRSTPSHAVPRWRLALLSPSGAAARVSTNPRKGNTS